MRHTGGEVGCRAFLFLQPRNTCIIKLERRKALLVRAPHKDVDGKAEEVRSGNRKVTWRKCLGRAD